MNRFEQQQPIVIRWHHPSKQRYYLALLECDLLGDWTLIKSWGCCHTHQGRMVSHAYASWEEGAKALERLQQVRQRRGYQVVFTNHQQLSVSPPQ